MSVVGRSAVTVSGRSHPAGALGRPASPPVGLQPGVVGAEPPAEGPSGPGPSGPGAGRLLVPFQTEVREAVLEGLPVEGAVGEGFVPELRSRAGGRLADAVGREGKGEGAASREARNPLRVDGYLLGAALLCPARTAREPFEWTAPTAARRLGLRALSLLHHRARRGEPGPAGGAFAAVEEMVAAERHVDPPTSLGGWLAGLGPAETAAVVVQAASWTARAWTAVPWVLLRPTFKVDSFRYQPFGADGGLRVEGRADATVAAADGHVVVNVGRREPAAVRLDALVRTLQVGQAPLRVVSVDPGHGRVQRLDVTEAVLELALEELVSAVVALGQPSLPTRPGRHCFGCPRHTGCRAGTAWRTAHRLPLE